MQLLHFGLFTALVALLVAAPAPAADAPLLGFTPGAAAEERSLEARFDAGLSKDDVRAWVERLSSRPHHLGSDWGRPNAEWMAGLFRSWGYETRIETYDALFPTPK